MSSLHQKYVLSLLPIRLFFTHFLAIHISYDLLVQLLLPLLLTQHFLCSPFYYMLYFVIFIFFKLMMNWWQKNNIFSLIINIVWRLLWEYYILHYSRVKLSNMQRESSSHFIILRNKLTINIKSSLFTWLVLL